MELRFKPISDHMLVPHINRIEYKTKFQCFNSSQKVDHTFSQKALGLGENPFSFSFVKTVKFSVASKLVVRNNLWTV